MTEASAILTLLVAGLLFFSFAGVGAILNLYEEFRKVLEEKTAMLFLFCTICLSYLFMLGSSVAVASRSRYIPANSDQEAFSMICRIESLPRWLIIRPISISCFVLALLLYTIKLHIRHAADSITGINPTRETRNSPPRCRWNIMPIFQFFLPFHLGAVFLSAVISLIFQLSENISDAGKLSAQQFTTAIFSLMAVRVFLSFQNQSENDESDVDFEDPSGFRDHGIRTLPLFNENHRRYHTRNLAAISKNRSPMMDPVTISFPNTVNQAVHSFMNQSQDYKTTLDVISQQNQSNMLNDDSNLTPVDFNVKSIPDPMTAPGAITVRNHDPHHRRSDTPFSSYDYDTDESSHHGEETADTDRPADVARTQQHSRLNRSIPYITRETIIVIE